MYIVSVSNVSVSETVSRRVLERFCLVSSRDIDLSVSSRSWDSNVSRPSVSRDILNVLRDVSAKH